MIKFLRKNHQVFILITLLYGLFAVYSIFFSNTTLQFLNHPFSHPLLGGLFLWVPQKTGAYVAFAFVSYLLMLFIGFSLTKLVINYQIVTKRSQFTAIFYITLSAFAYCTDLFSGAIIATLFLLFALNRIIGSADIRGNSYRFLDAGIFIALGSLFYLNLIFLLPFVWVSQLVLRPLSWRELVYSMVGVVIPFIYILTGAFVFNQSVAESWVSFKEWIMLPKVVSVTMAMSISIGFYALIILIASLFAFKKFGTSKIQVRKLFQVLFSLFVNLVLICLIVPSAGMEILYLFAVPASVLIAIYFTDCRASFVNRILLLLVLAGPLVVIFIK